MTVGVDSSSIFDVCDCLVDTVDTVDTDRRVGLSASMKILGISEGFW